MNPSLMHVTTSKLLKIIIFFYSQVSCQTPTRVAPTYSPPTIYNSCCIQPCTLALSCKPKKSHFYSRQNKAHITIVG